MAQPGTIEAVMTPYPYSIEADAHAGTAWSMLSQMHIHHMAVREGERIFGVVTNRDLEHAQMLGQDISPGSELRVADICDRNAYVVEPTTSLIEVLQNMAEQHRDVVLVARQGELVGIFTFGDACRHYAQLLGSESTQPPRR